VMNANQTVYKHQGRILELRKIGTKPSTLEWRFKNKSEITTFPVISVTKTYTSVFQRISTRSILSLTWTILLEQIVVHCMNCISTLTYSTIDTLHREMWAWYRAITLLTNPGHGHSSLELLMGFPSVSPGDYRHSRLK
jgi:hypothetical protein